MLPQLQEALGRAWDPVDKAKASSPGKWGLAHEHTSAWSEGNVSDALDTPEGSTEMEIGIRFLPWDSVWSF